jgi:cobalt/nickel transport system permease protein
VSPAFGSRRGFVEHSIDALRRAMERATAADTEAGRRGWLQQIDPRVKLAGLAGLATAVALAQRMDVLAALLALGVVLAVSSRLPIATVASGVWLTTLGFSLTLAVPALVLTPGRPMASVPWFGWSITGQGLASAGYLVLRAAATATFGFLLVFTTRWSLVLKALRAFRLPVVLVVVLGMTYRYILLLLDAAHDLFEARRSRAVGTLAGSDRRRLLAQTTGVLLAKSLQVSGEVYLAMQARGYRGEVYVLDDFAMGRTDWVALASFAAVTAVAVWAGR